MLLAEPLTGRAIGPAIAVPRHPGPGRLESACERCLCDELGEPGIAVAWQVAIPVIDRDVPVGDGCKAAIVIAGQRIPEIKAVAASLPIYAVRRRTCLRMGGIRVGLLPNFTVPPLVACPGQGRGRAASHRGLASAGANRSFSVNAVLSALPPC
jgi:GxxExxY protein